MARIDHVVMAVEDLGAAAKALETNYGLVAHPGGPHGDAGTANMYVPLGDDQYIELLAVTNASSRHPMVAALTRVLKDGDRLFNFALRAEDIEAEAERLAEGIFDVETTLSGGKAVGFRLTGVSGLVGWPILPWFIVTTHGREWIADQSRPHAMRPSGISRVEFGGDPETVKRRINDPDFPISVVGDRAGLAAIWIGCEGEQLELRL